MEIHLHRNQSQQSHGVVFEPKPYIEMPQGMWVHRRGAILGASFPLRHQFILFVFGDSESPKFAKGRRYVRIRGEVEPVRNFLWRVWWLAALDPFDLEPNWSVIISKIVHNSGKRMKLVLMKNESLPSWKTKFAQPKCRTLVELDYLLDVAKKFLEPLRRLILRRGLGYQVAGRQLTLKIVHTRKLRHSRLWQIASSSPWAYMVNLAAGQTANAALFR